MKQHNIIKALRQQSNVAGDAHRAAVIPPPEIEKLREVANAVAVATLPPASTLSVLRLVKFASTSPWVSSEPFPARVTMVLTDHAA